MKTLRRVVVFTVMAVLIVIYYIHLSSKTADDIEAVADTSVVGILLAQNFDLNYPTTPRDVVDSYSKIIKAYYGEEFTDEQLEGLALHARALFDAELLAYNDYDTYMVNLKAEIASYKLNNKKISNYGIEKSSHTVYITENGNDYARVNALYYVMEGVSDRTRTYERYTLRKDSEGKWKILYWELIPAEDYHGE